MADEVADDFYWISSPDSYFARKGLYRGNTRNTKCGIHLDGFGITTSEMCALADGKPRCSPCLEGVRV
ncbi:hypothetical protein [Streptomyces hydrogenans]|uniref:hypothetical protein n=1 Tax=Streptomyces hydrogenans TaxID=1873719 RepID=UPI0035E1B227